MFIFFLTTPAFSLVMFPGPCICTKHTLVCRIQPTIFHCTLAIEMLIRHNCEQEARPKDLLTFIVPSITYSWAFSAAERGAFSPQGFPFLPRSPQIFVGISDSELLGACFWCLSYSEVGHCIFFNTEQNIKKKLYFISGQQ